MTQKSTQPGCCPDPAGGPTARWFNGTTWTEQHALPPEPARLTIHDGFALLAMFSLLDTLIIGIPMLVSRGSGTDEARSMAALMAGLWLGWCGMSTLIWTAFAINNTIKIRRGR